jgi:plastocyanin
MTNNQKLMLTSMILVGFIMTAMPFAFAEQVSVSLPQGTSNVGCEETNECFLPYMITVNPGDEVVWSNDDVAAHTVTSGIVPTADGLFDSSIFMAGTTFSHTFDTLGKYDYFCMVHPWMVGQVFVTVGGGIEKDLGTIIMGSTVESNIEIDNLVANIVPSDGYANEAMMNLNLK